MNLSLADLEHYLAVAAYLVVRHGDGCMPIMERLEREVEAERAKVGNRERAQRLLADLMRKGVKGAAAG